MNVGKDHDCAHKTNNVTTIECVDMKLEIDKCDAICEWKHNIHEWVCETRRWRRSRRFSTPSKFFNYSDFVLVQTFRFLKCFFSSFFRERSSDISIWKFPTCSAWCLSGRRARWGLMRPTFNKPKFLLNRCWKGWNGCKKWKTRAHLNSHIYFYSIEM